LVLDGALADDPSRVGEYYRAHRAFSSLMVDPAVVSRWGLELRLVPGDILAFNQRRFLHGRRAFTSAGGGGEGARWLQGCYVRADDFANKYRTLHLAMARAPRGAESAPRLGTSCFR
jgi:gamma-butyrobetaine dioxygenase